MLSDSHCHYRKVAQCNRAGFLHITVGDSIDRKSPRPELPRYALRLDRLALLVCNSRSRNKYTNFYTLIRLAQWINVARNTDSLHNELRIQSQE